MSCFVVRGAARGVELARAEGGGDTDDGELGWLDVDSGLKGYVAFFSICVALFEEGVHFVECGDRIWQHLGFKGREGRFVQSNIKSQFSTIRSLLATLRKFDGVQKLTNTIALAASVKLPPPMVTTESAPAAFTFTVTSSTSE